VHIEEIQREPKLETFVRVADLVDK